MDDLTQRLASDLDGTFAELVCAHQDRLFSIALRLAGDPRDAEEIAQDAFVRAYRALVDYETQRIRELNLRAWLTKITVNLCRNRARVRRAVTVSIDGDADAPSDLAASLPAGAAASPAAQAERRESRAHWAALVAELPDRYRAAVVLRHVDGMSYAQMVEALGRPEGTLKAQVHRGLALLRTAHEALLRTESPGGRPLQEVLR